MKITKLFENRVLVLPDEETTKTTGGIYLPDTAKEKPRFGTVIQVGPGKTAELTAVKIPMNCKEGDRVFYHTYSGADFNMEGYPRPLRIMTEAEIICVVEE